MGSVFVETLRGYRIGLAALSAGLFAVSLVIVYTFDAFGGVEVFEEMLDLLPEAVVAMFRAQAGFGATATGYIAADYRHPFYLIAVFAFVITAASGAVAKEIERGSVLLMLAAPVARWRYLLARTGVLASGAVTLVFFAWFGTFVGGTVTGMGAEIDHGALLRVQMNTLALALAAGGVASLISALSSDGGQTVAWSAGVATAMYVIDFLSLIWAPAGPAGALSLFHYYDPLEVVQGTSLPWRDLAVLSTVALAGFATALIVFQRRDIAR